jgi:DNA-binding LacI/PurR family transcriptional regulator
VGVNDDLGLACLDFLQEEGCRVPEDVSVVGFDDTLDATRRRLTSYNFSNEAVIHSCLAHVLRPERGLRGRSSGPVEIEGFITRRESTGKP